MNDIHMDSGTFIAIVCVISVACGFIGGLVAGMMTIDAMQTRLNDRR